MKRAEFTAKTQRQMLVRSGGVCECYRCPGMTACRRPLGPGNTFFEHIVQCEVGGGNTLDNGAALTRTCWKLKTAKQDLPVIAKAKRRRDRHFGIRQRSGFRGWRRFNGTVVIPDEPNR